MHIDIKIHGFFKKNNSFINLLRLFNKTFRDYKFHISILAILSLFNGILEGIGVSTLIPLFSFVSKDGIKGNDFISKAIENFLAYLHITLTLKSLLIFITALFLLKTIVLFIITYVTVVVVRNFQTEKRKSLFTSTLKASWPYLSKQRLGYLDQILTTNIDNVSSLFACFITLILVSAKLLIYTVVATNISVNITSLALILGFSAFLFFKPLFRRNKNISAEIENLNRESSHYTNENIMGMKTVKSMGVERSILDRSYNYFDRMRKLGLNVVFISGLTDMLVQFFGVTFVLVVFTYFYKTAVFNLAAFAVIVYAINQIFLQIQGIQTQVHRISSMVPYLTTAEHYRDESRRHRENAEDTGWLSFNLNKDITFSDVSFFYNNTDHHPVIKDLSFSIKRNEMVGLIGPSGAGKTTIIDLLLRLYSPVSGHILLDGEDTSKIKLTNWRENIGYVSQDLFLMNDTVKNNILFYNESLSQHDIEKAASMANILEFIESLPQKFDTIIGERGIRLSGGQRQRIVLARILARHPKLLILDEATSALDNESEMLIHKAIENLRGKVTLLVVAHRLSTVASLDRILVLENGGIVEDESPVQLLKDKNSYFFKMYNLRN